VLVNRGFVSRKKLEAASRQSGQTPGVVDLVGVYRRHENRPQFVPQNQQGSTMFHYRWRWLLPPIPSRFDEIAQVRIAFAGWFLVPLV